MVRRMVDVEARESAPQPWSRGVHANVDLTGLGERVHLASPDTGLTTHIQDVHAVLHYEDLRDVVLVGHSYGGAVVTGVAGRARDRIANLIYFDAFVLQDGQSLGDVCPPGMAEALTEVARQAGEGWRVP
jgi:pimeloyl-ACP methyl ester carboxylesterase